MLVSGRVNILKSNDQHGFLPSLLGKVYTGLDAERRLFAWLVTHGNPLYIDPGRALFSKKKTKSATRVPSWLIDI